MTPNLRVNFWLGSNYIGLLVPLGGILRLTPRTRDCRPPPRPPQHEGMILGSQQEGGALGIRSGWLHAQVLNNSGQRTHSGFWTPLVGLNYI